MNVINKLKRKKKVSKLTEYQLERDKKREISTKLMRRQLKYKKNSVDLDSVGGMYHGNNK